MPRSGSRVRIPSPAPIFSAKTPNCPRRAIRRRRTLENRKHIGSSRTAIVGHLLADQRGDSKFVLVVTLMVTFAPPQCVAPDEERKDWMDRLTNRLFYKQLIEAGQDGRGRHVNVDELFNMARKDALADIERANKDSVFDAGFLGSTGWHWFGGMLSFVGQWVGFALYYGSALYIGSGGSV